MAAAIQRNFPHIHPGGVAPPAPDPRAAALLRAAAQGVPVPQDPAAPAPPAGGVFSSIRNGISAGMNLVADTIDSVAGGVVGQGAGLLGGLAGALGVQLRGGVQPDDPRVVAAGTGPVRGADARPLDQSHGAPVTALDEAGNQGQQAVVSALHSGPGQIDTSGPGRDIADTLEAPGGELSKIDPQIGMAMHAPALGDSVVPAARAAAAEAAPVVAKAVGAVGKAGGAVADAAGGAAKAVAKAVVGPDPELVKVAQINDTLDHPLPITANKLTLDSAGNANPAQIRAGDEAVTKNLIGMINPDETATRLTPKVLDDALNRSGGTIGDIAERTPIPAGQMGTALQPLVQRAIDLGAGDVPRLVPNYAKALLDKVGDDGLIPGAAFRNWDSDIGDTIRKTTDGGVRDDLLQLQRSARDTMASNITDPADAAALKAARKQYAYGMIVSPDVADTVTGLYPADQLMNRVTSNARGKRLMSTDNGGDIGDLAKVAELYTRKSPGATVNPPSLLRKGLGKVASSAADLVPGVRGAAQAVSNKVGQGVARMLVPKAAAPAAPAAKPLMLTYDPKLSPDAIPVTPEGQAVAPGTEQAREDMQTSQRVSAGGRGGTGRPAPATTYADYDLNAPEFQPPVTTTPAAEAPSALRAHAQEDFQRAPGAAARALPDASFPHDIAEPDTARVMQVGRPGEVAATDADNAALQDPGAVAARAAQESSAKAATDAEATKAAAAEAAKPKPTPEEQTKLDEIDKTISGSQSDIVKATLQKERDRVMKDVTARDAAEKTKAAAAELRTVASSITDPATQKAMLAKAEKLDPTPPAPKAKPEDEPLPSIEYADTPEWRAAHGLGAEDAQRAVITRQAYDATPDEVDAAAVQHANSPRAFDRAVDKILEKHRANEASTAAQGSQGPAAPAADAQAPVGGDQDANPPAGTQGAGKQPDAVGGDAGQPGDAVATETDDARLARIKATPGGQRTDADLDWARARSRAAAQGAETKQSMLDAGRAMAQRDTSGFAETLSTPIQQERARATLNQSQSFDGITKPRKQGIQDAITDGGVVETREGQRALVKPGGSYLLERQITKTGMDYAEHLVIAKAKFESDHPRAPDGTFTEKDPPK